MESEKPVKAESLHAQEFNSSVNSPETQLEIEDGLVKKNIETIDKPKRLLSLDALRGLTIILMITCNYQTINPFSAIAHAEWFGFTIADSIFPTFVFCMGLAIPLALSKALVNAKLFFRIFKRSVILWAIGAFLNGFPFTFPGLADRYRFIGVLHRLALCYLVTAIAYVLCKDAKKGSIKYYYLYYGFPLVGLAIWLGITFGLDVPECGRGSLTMECSAEGYIDTSIWGRAHNYQGNDSDPEGFLSMITACISCWLGLQVGLHISKNRNNLIDEASRYRKVAQFMLFSCLLLFIAYAFNPIIPVGKPLWTATYVLAAGGFSIILLSILMYLVDILGLLDHSNKAVRFIFRTMLKVGSNPLLIYALSEMLLGFCFAISVNYDGKGSTDGVADLWSFLYYNIWGSWCPDALGSLIWSQVFMWLVFVPIAWGLDKKGWYLRV